MSHLTHKKQVISETLFPADSRLVLNSLYFSDSANKQKQLNNRQSKCYPRQAVANINVYCNNTKANIYDGQIKKHYRILVLRSLLNSAFSLKIQEKKTKLGYQKWQLKYSLA